MTLRPKRAASMAAETPEMPAPTTQMSAECSINEGAPLRPTSLRRTMRVSGRKGFSSICRSLGSGLFWTNLIWTNLEGALQEHEAVGPLVDLLGGRLPGPVSRARFDANQNRRRPLLRLL